MQVTETLKDGLKRGYTITVSAAELDAKVTEKLIEAQPEVEIKGFRKEALVVSRSVPNPCPTRAQSVPTSFSVRGKNDLRSSFAFHHRARTRTTRRPGS